VAVMDAMGRRENGRKKIANKVKKAGKAKKEKKNKK
jgi:hypothetical protein